MTTGLVAVSWRGPFLRYLAGRGLSLADRAPRRTVVVAANAALAVTQTTMGVLLVLNVARIAVPGLGAVLAAAAGVGPVLIGAGTAGGGPGHADDVVGGRPRGLDGGRRP